MSKKLEEIEERLDSLEEAILLHIRQLNTKLQPNINQRTARQTQLSQVLPLLNRPEPTIH